MDFAKSKATGEARRCRTFGLTEEAATAVSLARLKCRGAPPAAANSLTRGRQRLSLRQTLRARKPSPEKTWKSSLLKEERFPQEKDGGQGGWGMVVSGLSQKRLKSPAHVSLDRQKEYNHLSVTYASLKQLVTEATLLPNSPRGRHKTGRLSLPGRQLRKDRAPPPA